MACGQNEENVEEEMLWVSEEVIDHPLGFVIDAGASVTKVLYRSKKDYSSGKPLKTLGCEAGRAILRMRCFNMNETANLVDFLKENCDINVGPEGNDEWWITGVTTQHFKKHLDSSLHIKTKIFSEIMALSNFFKNFEKLNISCFDTEETALKWAMHSASKYAEMFKTWKKFEDGTIIHSKFSQAANEKNEPSTKFLTGDLKEWEEKHLKFSGKIECPALVVHLGSAIPLFLFRENQPMETVDFLSGMGKMLCGLLEEITKETNFENFIKMAERGNLENVDLSTNDLANKDHEEEDWYKMPKDLGAFELGKLCSHNINGKGVYSKDDLAVGILAAMVKVITKVSFLNARLNQAKSILFTGSLSKYKIVRHHIQKNLILESILNNSKGMEIVKVHVLKHSGFLCALGVWLENVERQKKNKQSSH